MRDLWQERIKRLRLIGESAKRRSTVYSGLTKLDDKNTAQSLGALNRASAPGKKIQKFGFIELPSEYGESIKFTKKLINDGDKNLVLNRQTEEALELFVRMAKVDDDTLETHFALGHLFRRRGEVDRAIRVHKNLLARPSLNEMQRDQAW